MKLSIVIPIYNAERYLKRCIESTINNDEEEIEIILINDGSKDNSEKICQEFTKKDKRIKYIFTENKGCSSARNLGIDLSVGEYIWFIDSDDFIEKNAIKNILEEIKKEPEIIIFGTRQKEIRDEIDRIILPKEESKNEFVYNQTELFNPPWNKIYKKEIIKSNKIYFLKNCHMGEDMVFNFKYFYYINKINFIKKYLYNYWLEDGVSYSLEKRIEIFKSFDEIFEFYRNKNFEIMKAVFKKYYEINAIKCVYKTILYSSSDKDIKKFFLRKSRIEIKKRKEIFKTEFLSLQLFCFIGYKITKFYPKLLIFYKNLKNR